MRITPIHVIIALVLTSLFIYTMYKTKRKEQETPNLLSYVEAYYSSMMPPQSNTPQEFVWFTGLNLQVFNSVTHFNHTTNIGNHIDAILAIRPVNKPISFWIDPRLNSDQLINELRERGFNKIFSFPFMTWQVTAINKPTYTIKRITPETRDAFHSIAALNFGLDEETSKGFQRLLAQSPAENYLIYLDDKPVGIGTLFITGTTGAIFNIGVLPEYQKQGYGTAVSQFLMHRAYELNLKQVILNSSPNAYKMYQKLGFVKNYDLDIYG